MNTLALIFFLILFVIMVLVSGMRLSPELLSIPELERRAKRSSYAKDSLWRARLMPAFSVLQRLSELLLLVVTIVLAIAAFGWILGIIIAIVVVVTYGVIARYAPIHSVSQAILYRFELPLLQFTEKIEKGLLLFRETAIDTTQFRRFDSREDLEELVSRSGDILTPNEQLLLIHTLQFKEKQVSSIMTPRGVIDSIKKGEFLGPLVLSELHDLGHSRLPVIDEDLDHVVGILYLRDLLSLDRRNSATAEKIMSPKVFYIHEDDSLEHALAAFLKAQHHLFVVINSSRETVGLLSLEDVIEALIGRRIIDEDDTHADLRAVAESKGKSNNTPAEHIDV